MSNNKTQAVPEKSSTAKYRIRDKANTPQKMFLYDPVTLEQTEDYLMVVSSLSDAFTEARDAGMREASSIAQIPEGPKRKEAIREQQLMLTASLVAGWSFDEYSQKAVAEFLRDAPQVRNQVMEQADDSASFFGKPSIG